MTTEAQVEAAARCLWGHDHDPDEWERATDLERADYFACGKDVLEVAEAARWQPIATAPRDGTAVDLWILGEAAEVEFYCPQSHRHPDRVHRSGRVANVHWIDGDWRPVAGLHRLHGLYSLPISILYWQPLPPPPAGEEAGE